MKEIVMRKHARNYYRFRIFFWSQSVKTIFSGTRKLLTQKVHIHFEVTPSNRMRQTRSRKCEVYAQNSKTRNSTITGINLYNEWFRTTYQGIQNSVHFLEIIKCMLDIWSMWFCTVLRLLPAIKKLLGSFSLRCLKFG